MTEKIAFIGAGNMASSLLEGLVKQGYKSEQLWASDPNLAKLAHLKQRLQIQVTADNNIAVQAADIVIFAIKPQSFAATAQALSAALCVRKPLVISIAAGITCAQLQRWCGAELALVRCMPNTPALIGYGATGMHANSVVSAAQKDTVEKIMQAVGIAFWVTEEHLIDAVTALSGSGPAYFFLILEALVEAGIKLGLPETIAKSLAIQTALGAAKMAQAQPDDLVRLRQQVTSPGGTTEVAINRLEIGGLRQLFLQALMAARQRSLELAK